MEHNELHWTVTPVPASTLPVFRVWGVSWSAGSYLVFSSVGVTSAELEGLEQSASSARGLKDRIEKAPIGSVIVPFWDCLIGF